MKKLLYILIFTILLIPDFITSQWVTQNSGTTQHLYDVYFINTQTGWACGNNGMLLKTTNGGSNWFAQNSGVTFPIYSIHFIDENAGYGVTRVDGYFIKTTNGGLNWDIIYFSPKSFESIFFVNSLTGWAAGISGTGWVFRTTDGGANWDSVSLSTGGKDVEFINSTTGWTAGGEIHKSTDGGVSWVLQLSPSSDQIQSISFPSENTGYAISLAVWRVYKTTDSGNNWQILTTLPECFNSHCIYFSNINTGWVSGDCGQMFSTTNGGLNWFQQQTNTNSFLQSVQFITDSVGWAVGGAGKIIHTSTGGAIIGIEPINNSMPTEFKLYQNYPNPFNPITNVKFQMPKEGFVTLKVFDLLGREIDVLVNEELKAGEYEIQWNGSAYSSGIYYYTLKTENYAETKKMILLK